MSQSWYTKEDVLKGLEEVSPGRRVADVDSSFLLYGDKQPPRPLAYGNEEEELELLYGRGAAHMLAQSDGVGGGVGAGDAHGPDLNGITQLIREAQNNEYSPNEDSDCSPTKGYIISKPRYNAVPSANVIERATKDSKSNKLHKSEKSGLSSTTDFDVNVKMNAQKLDSNINENNNATVNTASKLNPDAKKFVPRSLQTSTTSSTSTPSSTSRSTLTSGETCESYKEPHIDEKKDYIEDKKELAQILKSQISIKTNDAFEEQQRANKAIVNLLKLYAKPVSEKPVKLLPPDYFEKSAKRNIVDERQEACEPKNNYDSVKETDRSIERMTSLHDVDNVTHSETFKLTTNSDNDFKNCDIKNTSDPLCEKIPSRVGTQDENIEIFNETSKLTPDMASCDIDENVPPKTKPSQTTVPPIDPYLQESIDKVNNWLNDKPVVTGTDDIKLRENIMRENKNAPSPVLNASAVSYKRKESSTCKSPCEVTKKVPKGGVAEYKPSSYAEDLHKKYSERSNVSSPAPVLTMWDKLEADLKKKDIEIRNRNKKA